MSKLTVLSVSQCTDAILALKKAAKDVHNTIHVIAFSTLVHTRDHGDSRGAVELLNALPNGQRVKALAHWYNVMSNGAMTLSFDKKADSWKAKLREGRSAEDFNVVDAEAIHFADLTAEKGPTAFTLANLRKFLQSKIDNAAKLADGSDVVSKEAREAARAALAAIGA